MEALYMKTGISWPKGITFGGGDVKPPKTQINALGRSSINNSTTTTSAPQKIEKSSSSSSSSRFSFKYTLPTLWRNGNDGVILDDGEEIGVEEEEEEERERNGSWVLKILRVQSLWKDQQRNGVDGVDGVDEEKVGNEENVDCDLSREGEGEGCGCNDDDDDEEEIEGCKVDEEEEEEGLEFDKDSFSRLLRRVSLTDARLYARMSFLGKLAYSIPKIKSANHLKHHGFHFVTSSLEKKEQSTNAEKEEQSTNAEKEEQSINAEKEPNSTEVQKQENKTEEMMQESEKQKISIPQISASAAYHVAASAASYLQSHTRSILSFRSSKDGTENISPEEGSESEENAKARSSELASFVATTDSVTAVVAAKEEKKQAVAKELNTASPSPCQWFICDEEQSATRFFVIQGSESLASWQANLLFEPIQFEGLDVLVHRGIYEAAKGIYDQMLPDVHDHLKLHGNLAKFRFTGHSLGGSLSLLVNLMLLLRGEVPASSLLPVIMFGAPYVMCGGDQLLRRMGLPRSHVQGINMHRDIVPRAFSCTCPDHIAELLKAVNGNFRNHPCLKNQKLLYSPMGDILILQPEEKFSPHHELLPPGSGLYLLSCSLSDSKDPEKQLQAAKTLFFNSPHPLEILSDRSAYGSDGAIYRDHDMNSYLKCVRAVIRQELNQIRKTKRQHRRRVWWQQITPEFIHAGAVVGQRVSLHTVSLSQSRVSGIFHTGRESFKRFSRLVASQHTHLLVVLLFPAQLLVLGTFAVTRLR